MFESGEREEIRQAVRVQWIVWVVMAASVVLYLGLAHLFEADLHGATSVEPDLRGYIRIVFQAFTVIVIVITPYVRRSILRKPNFGSGQEAAIPQLGSAGPVTQSARRHTAAHIVSIALSEQIALLGLLLFLFGDSFRTLYMFAAVSIISMIAYVPRAVAIEALAVELKRRMG